MIRSLIAICMLPAIMGAIGCGGGGGNKVTGKVTYQGEPVESGSILFDTSEGVKSGELQKGGTYTVEGLPDGAAKIAVLSSPPSAGEGVVTDPNDPNSAPTADESSYVAVPDKYSQVETSGLTYEVKSGDQTHNIDLE